MDALVTEKLVKEKKIQIKKAKNSKVTKKLMGDFNLGLGEAETLALALSRQCNIISTDNRQGRKAAAIYNLNLVGSIDVIVSLCKLRLIDKNKAIDALKKLRVFGWFEDYLIENALDEVKNV
jgi:predicted nucleic acid-binding protein